MDRSVLEAKALAELRQIASALELRGYQRLKKAELIDMIAGGQAAAASASNGSAVAEADAVVRDDAASDGAVARSGDQGSAPSDQRVRARHRDEEDERPARTRSRERADDDDEQALPARGNTPPTGGGDRPAQDRPAPDRLAPDRFDDRRGDDAADGSGESHADGQDDDGPRRRNKRNRNRNKGAGQPIDATVEELEVRTGVLDLLPEGYGFLRTTGYTAGDLDVYVSQSFVRRHGLRRGDLIEGPVRHNRGNDKFPALARIDTVEGEPLGADGQPGRRASFKDLTPLFPDQRLRLETADGNSPIAMRIVDMLAPIGLGQRGLIVSPPKAGKTSVLKQLAHAVETNHPDVHLMVVLVDERPEEVTDFERSTSGEVIASTFDRPAEDHTQVAEIAIERAKRLVERGRDVVVLLDSITRLGRAYNLAAPVSGRILSGGMDSAALYPPKRFFGAARNIEGGGSLTILATALIDTGSKMDEVIFEEFKGTGNMELRLDRKMEQKRIFPAIDVQQSGTRREELLLDPAELDVIWKLRRVLSQMDSGAALELLIDKLKATKNNAQFLSLIAKSNLG